MPKLICTTCRREVYTAAQLGALFGDERRCTRCGSELIADRRASAGGSTSRGGAFAGPPRGTPE